LNANNVDVEKLSFEEALEQLEQLVQRLDAGDLPLAEAIDTFRLAMALRTHCAGLLDEAEASIEQLQVQGGEPETTADDARVSGIDYSDNDPFAEADEGEEANPGLFGDNPFGDE
jgi:exodeoxyribonuclease VII small subunit